MTNRKNRLADQTSPYLQQHADNPVDWYPWGEQALQKAREEDKPILLSIGYSACHWCHVMAHESFEDAETAKLMNALYVNIKIDREERPDLDKIYQTAHSLLTQRAGGWPLTMILTPGDQIPFFAGTYFPETPRHGLPGFTELLRHVEGQYRQHRSEIADQNDAMRKALNKVYGPQGISAPLESGAGIRARGELEQAFDSQHGGFGSAPKFPHPTNLEFLLHHWAVSAQQGNPDQRALHMAALTLKKMALGGIYDHLGGGFCRYCVDDSWTIPHFEKMLYDNGPLLTLYSQAAVATASPLFERTALETANWVMREMQSPEGGYYSSLDADSEGEEGKYYAWETDEIQSALADQNHKLFARRFGLDRPPNFEGKWHLRAHVELTTLATEFGQTPAELMHSLDRSRQTLFQQRENRIRPGRDEKILTSWNALMIKAMASAGRLLDKPQFIESAERALDFIQRQLWKENRLLATYKDGRAHLNAYLDDYGFLIDGILELLQARWREADLSFARALTEVLLEQFEDREHGGFYFTSRDHEQLIQRVKTFPDEATPSGNGIAASALARLGHLLGEPRYLEAVERTLKAAANSINNTPSAHASLLLALEHHLRPQQVVILRGQGETLTDWHRRCTKDHAPQRFTLAIPNEAQNLPEALAAKTPHGEIVAYICEGMTCSAPITQWQELQKALTKTTVKFALED